MSDTTPPAPENDPRHIYYVRAAQVADSVERAMWRRIERDVSGTPRTVLGVPDTSRTLLGMLTDALNDPTGGA